jgi:hypothetical protein
VTRTEPRENKLQADGQIRRWVWVPEMENRYLRVILLAAGHSRCQSSTPKLRPVLVRSKAWLRPTSSHDSNALYLAPTV